MRNTETPDDGRSGWFTFRCSGEHAASGRVNVWLGEEEIPEDTLRMIKKPGVAGECAREGCSEPLALALTEEEAQWLLGLPAEVHGWEPDDHGCVRCDAPISNAKLLCEACTEWAETGR